MIEKHDELCFTVVKYSYNDTVSCFKENDLLEKLRYSSDGWYTTFYYIEYQELGKPVLLN